MVNAANTAEGPAINKSNHCAAATWLSSGAKINNNTPPKLITPACNNADTDVGDSTT